LFQTRSFAGGTFSPIKKENPMRVPALALLGAFGLAASVATANAAPVVPAMPAPEVSNIIQVAQGCGRGFQRNYRGFCVPSRAYRPYAYAPRYPRYYRSYGYYGGGNEYLNRPSPSDNAARWLNAQEARRNWGY
jgi:hypothetical protein